jgi:toxin ParE1/3/4
VNGRIVKRPVALLDLDQAADDLQRQSSPERAIRFLRGADATFARLAGMPSLGTRYEPDDPISADLRFFPITRSRNSLVDYRPIAGGIEVVRLLHGARDIPGILEEEFGVGEETDGEDEDGIA